MPSSASSQQNVNNLIAGHEAASRLLLLWSLLLPGQCRAQEELAGSSHQARQPPVIYCLSTALFAVREVVPLLLFVSSEEEEQRPCRLARLPAHWNRVEPLLPCFPASSSLSDLYLSLIYNLPSLS